VTLAELKYIVALAQEQHFGRAAAICCVSQPALSMAIKKLEKELEVALFTRSRSRITLTATGEQVVTQAKRVLGSVSELESIAAAGRDHLSSPLRVGAILTAGPYLLPQVMPHLQRHPKPLSIKPEQALTNVLYEKLIKGALDVIIVSLPFEEADVVTQELFEDPLQVLLPATHPLAAKAHMAPTDLTAQNLLLLEPGHCLRDQVLAACPHLQESVGPGGESPAAASASSLETLRNMVEHNLGVAVVPLMAASSLCRGQVNLTVRPFQGVSPARKLALAWRTSFPRHKAIDVLRRALQACNAAYGYVATQPEPAGRGLMVDNSLW
jgi:LysR family hydrogen peroxide-inducible transcriptional activator